MAELGPDSIVASGYDVVANAYAALEREQWPRQRWLSKVLAALPAASAVLDVGCGAGMPVVSTVVEAGHGAVGIDVSERQIVLARANVPQATFMCCDVRDVSFAPASFDAILSFYAIDHIPREQHHQVFAKLYEWLRPGGTLLVAIEDGDEPGVVGDWLGAPMYFSHFDAATTLEVATSVGFVADESAVERQLEQGREVPYLWLLARRP